MISLYLTIIASLARALGGKTGELVTQLVDTIGTVTLDKAEWDAFAGPWIKWANAIVDAGRDPTDDEHGIARDLADAVHARNQALANAVPPDQLPPLPLPPGA